MVAAFRLAVVRMWRVRYSQRQIEIWRAREELNRKLAAMTPQEQREYWDGALERVEAKFGRKLNLRVVRPRGGGDNLNRSEVAGKATEAAAGAGGGIPVPARPAREGASPIREKANRSGSQIGSTRMGANEHSIVGDLINFRGMVYAPVNEQGVVFLFGKVMEDLNMYVEEIKSGFPDCIARRFVGTGWKRVRVEFEFRSKNFHDHGHDPGACDVIVCWTHDWADCPLEVIELREIISDLEVSGQSS